MTFTFLVNKGARNSPMKQEEVTYKEWKAICLSNRGLPKEQRRWFIRLYDNDSAEWHCVFIEAPSYEYYLDWHRNHMAHLRNLRAGRNYRFISMQTRLFTDSEKEFGQILAGPEDEVERTALANISVWELERALAGDKPWGNSVGHDVIQAYIHDRKRGCTKPLSEKYGKSAQTVRAYKREFERYAVNFLIEDS